MSPPVVVSCNATVPSLSPLAWVDGLSRNHDFRSPSSCLRRTRQLRIRNAKLRDVENIKRLQGEIVDLKSIVSSLSEIEIGIDAESNASNDFIRQPVATVPASVQTDAEKTDCYTLDKSTIAKLEQQILEDHSTSFGESGTTAGPVCIGCGELGACKARMASMLDMDQVKEYMSDQVRDMLENGVLVSRQDLLGLRQGYEESLSIAHTKLMEVQAALAATTSKVPCEVKTQDSTCQVAVSVKDAWSQSSCVQQKSASSTNDTYWKVRHDLAVKENCRLKDADSIHANYKSAVNEVAKLKAQLTHYDMVIAREEQMRCRIRELQKCVRSVEAENSRLTRQDSPSPCPKSFQSDLESSSSGCPNSDFDGT